MSILSPHTQCTRHEPCLYDLQPTSPSRTQSQRLTQSQLGFSRASSSILGFPQTILDSHSLFVPLLS